MGINIEFNTSEISAPELDALRALVDVLSGRKPGGKSLLEVAGLGTDADRPRVTNVTNVAPPPPVVVAPPPSALAAMVEAAEGDFVVDDNEETVDHPFVNVAEGLLAAEAERVAAQRPGVAGSAEVDVNGIPWDSRIHASTKATNKDGSWRNKPKVDPTVLADVTAQLKALMALPTPDAPAVVDPAAAFGGAPANGPLPINVDNADTGSAGPAVDNASSDTRPLFERMGDAVRGAAPPPPAEAATTEPASPSMTAFAGVMRVVASKQAAGTLSTELVASLCASLGLSGVRDLAARPDMIPAFEALLP